MFGGIDPSHLLWKKTEKVLMSCVETESQQAAQCIQSKCIIKQHQC